MTVNARSMEKLKMGSAFVMMNLVAHFVKIQDVQELNMTVVIMEIATLQHTNALAVMDGQEKGAKFQIAKENPIALIVDIAMLPSTPQYVPIALKAGWAQVVATLVLMENKCQWIVGIVFVIQGGLALAATLSAPAMAH